MSVLAYTTHDSGITHAAKELIDDIIEQLTYISAGEYRDIPDSTLRVWVTESGEPVVSFAPELPDVAELRGDLFTAITGREHGSIAGRGANWASEIDTSEVDTTAAIGRARFVIASWRNRLDELERDAVAVCIAADAIRAGEI